MKFKTLLFAVLLVVSLAVLQVPEVKAELRTFGYTTAGGTAGPPYLDNQIVGSVFTCPDEGIAENITVRLKADTGTWSGKVKCAIYKHSDLRLIGVTEEREITRDIYATWYTFNFPSPKPMIGKDDYVLVAWANDSTNNLGIVFDTGSTGQGHIQAVTYDGFPDPLAPTHNDRKYSIYCTYTYVSSIASQSSTATSSSQQRKMFYANGLYWTVYSDGLNLVYRTSANGSTWSSPSVLRTGTSGSQLSVWVDGLDFIYIHLKYGSANYPLARRGFLNSNGSITWNQTEQTVQAQYYSQECFIAKDSSGYFWAVYGLDGTGPYVNRERSDTSTPTWASASSWFTETYYAVPVIVPLTGDKMMMVWSRNDGNLRASYYDGASWGTAQNIATIPTAGYFAGFSVVAYGNIVHVAYLSASNDICHVYFNTSWMPPVTIQASVTSTSHPVLSVDNSIGNLYCFWAGSPTANHIYYKKYTASTGTWASAPTDWIDESGEGLTANNSLTCAYQDFGGYIGLIYMTGSSSPYNVKFATLSFLDLNLRVKDANGNPVHLANVTVTMNNIDSFKLTDSSGWANWTNMGGEVQVKVKYQDVWVNGTFTITMNTDKTVDVLCNVYSFTVYVTDVNNEEKSGATLTLTRTDGYNYTADGLSPVTAGYYNSTHARYVWSQLANQTASYTVSVDSEGQTASTTTTLTENTEKTITLPSGTTSPSVPGGYTPPPAEQPPYVPPAPVLPVVPGPEFEVGIWIIVGVVGVAVVVAVAGRSKPTLQDQWRKKTRRTGDSSRKWRKKMKRK